MDGRTHVLPRLNEFSGAVLSFFRAFSLDHATERLTRTTVQGNFFFLEGQGQDSRKCRFAATTQAVRGDKYLRLKLSNRVSDRQ